ncbi:MAG: hypothetical protein RLZ77_1853, partial [Bacteroidota bacterium]
KTSVYVSNYTTTWRPAISSGFGANKFAFATSDVANANVNTTLTSASINTTNFTNLSLDCSVYYSHYLADGLTSIPDSLVIEVSTNNGTSWTRVQTFIEDQGIGTRFTDISLNLSAYINVNQFRFRFRYRGEWCDGVAIDDVKLYGNRPLATTYSWSPITGNNLFLNAAGTTPYTGGSVANIYYKPTQAQIDTGGVFPFTATAILSNGCSASRSINVTLTANLWSGASSSNWNDLGNWCGGILPTPASRVVIPANATRFPILSNIGEVKSLRIDAGATMTIASTGTLNLGENLANAGTFANNGILNLNGTGAQVIPGTGVISSMNILRIANRGSGVSLNNSMFVDNEIRPDSGKLNLGNFDITIKSNATRTASVQKIGNTSGFLYGFGRFVVERYIPTGTGAGQHAKSWQHMAVPTNGGQTIKQAWQEGAFAANANANPGFGTMITGAVLNATNAAIGFDAYTPNGGASIKTYNGSLNKWDFLTNTTNTPVYNPKGYLLFVRGDRSVINFSGANSQPIPATLRTRGKIFEPVTNEPQIVNLAPNVLESIGNPYASAIDFSQIEFSDGLPELITNKFWIFDPTLNTANNFGGWQLLTQTVSGDFTPVPGGTVNYPIGVINSRIQSGQAFIMQAGTAGGSVTFTEDAKLSGSANTFRLPRPVLNRMSMGINLHASHNGVLVDGAMVVWDRSFTNSTDQDDAIKLMNTAENFGIINNAKILTLESRKIIASTDTIKLYIKNLRRQSYQMKFNPKFFEPEVNSITLIDKFTNQSTTILKNDTSTYVFTVGTQAASFDSSRFFIVLNIKKRIQAITLTQSEQDQNEIVKNKLQPKISTQSVSIYPNPVSGNKLTLSVQNFEKGEYYFEIKNILGVVVKKMNLTVLDDTENFNIELPKHTAKGVYYLQITNGLMEERMQMVVN